MEKIVVRSLRHLDALVAEKLMGFVWGMGSVSGRIKLFPPGEIELVSFSRVNAPDDLSGLEKWEVFIPHYSTWLGLEPVIRNREEAGFRWDMGGVAGDAWAMIMPKDDLMFDDSPECRGDASTAPVAFCIAALVSTGYEVVTEGF